MVHVGVLGTVWNRTWNTLLPGRGTYTRGTCLQGRMGLARGIVNCYPTPSGCIDITHLAGITHKVGLHYDLWGSTSTFRIPTHVC